MGFQLRSEGVKGLCLAEITSSYKVRKYMYMGEGKEGSLYLGADRVEGTKWSW